ncbi:MAG: DUF6783 domain-containing protein [Ruminococcus sp.]
MKKAFCKMCVTICGRFCPDEGGAVYFLNRSPSSRQLKKI